MGERAAAANAVIVAHKSAVSFFGIPPEGSMLLSAASEGLKKWTLPEGNYRGSITLEGPIDARAGLFEVSSLGKILASWSLSEVVLYTPAGALRGSLLLEPASRRFAWAALSPDEKWLAVSSDSAIFLASTESQGDQQLRVQRKIEADLDLITRLAIRESLLIAGSADGRISTWSIPECMPQGLFETGQEITSMIAVDEPAAVATGHRDGRLRLTSLSGGKTLFSVNVSSAVRALEADSMLGLLVSGAADGSVDTWSLENGKHIATKKVEFSDSRGELYGDGKRGSLSALAASAKAGVVAIGGTSGQIVLLDWPSLDIRTHLFDRGATPVDAKGVSYTVLDRTTGRTVTYTLPCGSTIPRGAVCVCNCVPGAAARRYIPPARTTPAYAPAPSYSPPVTVPGGTITRPCTPTPVPEGYVCTCNCIPGR